MAVIGEDRQEGWSGAEARSVDPVRALMVALVAASFASLALAAFRRFLNGDEYIFLSQIYRAFDHRPIAFSQTAYVHLFSWWLPHVGAGEADQIVAGRLVMVAAWAVALWLTYRLGRRLAGPTAALAGVTLFSLFSYALMSAESFRIDGLLLPCLLGAALLLVDPSPLRVGFAGVLSGLAFVLSLKAALWAPALAGVLAVGLLDARRRIASVAAGTIGFAATCGLLLAVHSWLIARPGAGSPGFSEKQLAHVGGYMLFGHGFLPKPGALGYAVAGNLPMTVLLAVGLVLLVVEARVPERRGRSLILACLTLPILSVLFYANAFPYAYVFLLPGACLVAGKGFARYAEGSGIWRRAVCMLFLGFSAIPLVFLTWPLRHDQTAGDRQLLETVHRLFPKPVPYIDLSGLVASFPRPVTVITELGLAGSKRSGTPAFADYIRRDHPPLLIVNTTSLDVFTPGVQKDVEEGVRLLPADRAMLARTYAPFWGEIYLAGRAWKDLGAGALENFRIVVPGTYTLLSSHPVAIDGTTYRPGSAIRFEAESAHRLATLGREDDLRILWGRDLAIPDAEPLATLTPSTH